jgi:hypothetical protein
MLQFGGTHRGAVAQDVVDIQNRRRRGSYKVRVVQKQEGKGKTHHDIDSAMQSGSTPEIHVSRHPNEQ